MSDDAYEPIGLSLEIFKQRYAFTENETWPEACLRLARHISSCENINKREDWQNKFFKEIASNRFCPGGRIWFGAGRPKSNLINCFILDVEDSREGWGKTCSDSILVSGVGGGIGINYSKIRPKGTLVSGTGGSAQGAVAFMRIINAIAEEIRGGGNRRSAHMMLLNINHGDIEEFLGAKLDDGQLSNANISVAFNIDFDEFMDLVNNNGDLSLLWRGVEFKKISARDIWNKIIKHAYDNGEPGLLNLYYANKMNTLYYYKNIVGCNPCVTGDTIVAVADGRGNVPIRQLAEEGFDIPVYCINDCNQIVVRMMRNPRITGVKQPIYKITLDNGSTIRVTSNHKFMMRNGEYRETNQLKNGDSLRIMTKYRASMKDVLKKQRNGTDYWWITHRTNNIAEHRLIADHYYPNFDKNLIVHHKNKNGLDNTCQNRQHNDYLSELQLKTFDIYVNKYGKIPLLKEFKQFCRENNISSEIGRKSSPFRSYHDLKHYYGAYNHKIIKVEFDGYKNVYNGTVDEFHNYFVGGFETKTKNNKQKFSYLNCKNCGEVIGNENISCVLGSLVLPRFVTDGKINWDMLDYSIRVAVRFLDNVISVTQYPLKEIEDEAMKTRKIGLGITGLHDMLLLLGYNYASEESIKIINKIFDFIKNKAYETSTYLAVEKGSFQAYDKEQFMKSGFVKTLKNSIKMRIKEYGSRCGNLLSIAPTGTISILCGNCSSGIEPIFGPAYVRKYYDKKNGDKMKEEIVFHPIFNQFMVDGKDVSHFESLLDIPLEIHFKMQHMIQSHVDQSISKTIMIDKKRHSKDDIENLIKKYFAELKGVTIYANNSRENQPITPLTLENAKKLWKKNNNNNTNAAQSCDSCKSGLCEL